MSKDYPTFDEKFSVALIELGIRALLLGGVACNIYGSTRYSEDVDWWIDPTKGIKAWIESVLHVCEHTKERWEIVRLRDHALLGSQEAFQLNRDRLVKIVKTDALLRFQTKESMVDAFFLPNNLEDFEMAWSRSQAWDGSLRVLHMEDLIQTKMGTHRHKDLEDLRFLRRIPKRSN